MKASWWGWALLTDGLNDAAEDDDWDEDEPPLEEVDDSEAADEAERLSADDSDAESDLRSSAASGSIANSLALSAHAKRVDCTKYCSTASSGLKPSKRRCATKRILAS